MSVIQLKGGQRLKMQGRSRSVCRNVSKVALEKETA